MIERQFPVWNEYFGRHLPRQKAAEILDIGCGEGGFLHFLKSKGYKNFFGIDISGEQLKKAKALGVDQTTEADVFDFLRSREEKYDLVFAGDFLEHFKKEEIMEIFDLVFRSLRPGGKFLIKVPNGESVFGTRYLYSDFTHEMSFTAMSLSQLFRTAGFEEMSFYPTRPVAHGVKSALRLFLWRVIEIIISLVLLVEMGSRNGILTHNLVAVAKK